jgi:hypothetical protein
LEELEDASSCESVVDLVKDRVKMAGGRLQLDVDDSSVRGNIVVRGTLGGSVWSLIGGVAMDARGVEFWGELLELEANESSSLCGCERGSSGGIDSLSLSVGGEYRVGLDGIIDVVLLFVVDSVDVELGTALSILVAGGVWLVVALLLDGGRRESHGDSVSVFL